MEPLATLTPGMAEIDILVDVRLIEIDQLMPIPLRIVQPRAHLFDEPRPPRGIGTPKQLSSLLPRQIEPVQGDTDGLAAIEAVKPRLHEPDQTLERPAWLGVRPGYGQRGCLLLGRPDFGAERGGDLWAKGGRPPVRR